jgi:hypothetical protein
VPKSAPQSRTCPQCGNTVRFSVYVFNIHTRHCLQDKPMKFSWAGNSPKSMNVQISLFVCQDCALPLGMAPKI